MLSDSWMTCAQRAGLAIVQVSTDGHRAYLEAIEGASIVNECPEAVRRVTPSSPRYIFRPCGTRKIPSGTKISAHSVCSQRFNYDVIGCPTPLHLTNAFSNEARLSRALVFRVQ